jgi:hypothetical protein
VLVVDKNGGQFRTRSSLSARSRQAHGLEESTTWAHPHDESVNGKLLGLGVSGDLERVGQQRLEHQQDIGLSSKTSGFPRKPRYDERLPDDYLDFVATSISSGSYTINLDSLNSIRTALAPAGWNLWSPR